MNSLYQLENKYEVIKQIGVGSYGSVVKAKCLKTKEVVAIKKITHLFDDLVDGKRVLREIALLKRIDHPHIVKLKEIIVPENKWDTFNEIYLVMEYAPADLKKLFKSKFNLDIQKILKITYNILLGLRHIHSADVWHRDLKPANVLVFDDGSAKICDFGLARTVEENKNKKQEKQNKLPKGLANIPKSQKLQKKKLSRKNKKIKNVLTSHVVTRWYRAPELILIEKNYDNKIDIWSLGCIFGELLQMMKEHASSNLDRVPLFPGQSCFPLSPDSNAKIIKCGFPVSQMDQLIVITKVLGFPSDEDLSFISDKKALEYMECLPKKNGENFRQKFHAVDQEVIDFLIQCLRFNPQKRISIDEAIKHPIFDNIRDRQLEKQSVKKVMIDFEDQNLKTEQDLRRLYIKEIQNN